MIIILIGPPGSGKSTQSQLLVDVLHLPFLSIGEIIRNALKTSLFSSYKKKVEEGNLLPDKVVFDIIGHKFNEIDIKTGFVMEGFPRTVGQALWMDEFLMGKNTKVDRVIYLDNMGTETIKKRIFSRLQCNACSRVFSPEEIEQEHTCPLCLGPLYDRQDDQESVIENRISQYHQQSLPVKKYYDERELLVSVDASKSINDVFHMIFGNLEESNLFAEERNS